MKELIMPNWKTLLPLVFLLFLGFTTQVKAQEEIMPLLGTDIAIAGDNDYADHLPEEPLGWTADVEFDGSQYLVVWTGLGDDIYSGDENIYGRFITTSGLFNGNFFPIAANKSIVQEQAAVAFNGVNYLVVWVELSPAAIKGQLITRSGVFIGEEIAVSPSDHTPVVDGVDVASDGTDFLVVWTRDDDTGVDTWGQRIKGNGTLDGVPFEIGVSSTIDRDPSIFYGDGKYLVAWERGTDYYLNSSRNIYATLIDASNGNQTDPFPITTGSNLNGTKFRCGGSTGISFDGTNFIVAWHSNNGGMQKVNANRISPTTGELLDGLDGILLDEGIYVDCAPWVPQVAFDGNSWLVVWNKNEGSDPETLLGVRVSGNGDILDQSLVTLSKVNDSSSYKEVGPFIASDGTNYLITWKDRAEQVFQLVGSGIPTASTDGPFLVTVGDTIEMDGSASFSPKGLPLTYNWDFGDNSTPNGTTEVVTHTYAAIGNYTVTLLVYDGTYYSKPFVTTATVVGSTGGGQQKNVDSFLTFISPEEKTTSLPAGTTTYDISLVYGPTIDSETLSVTLNGTPFAGFHPVAGGTETVTINLEEGRNTLLFMIDGIRPDGHVATDRDRLTFVVK